MAKLKIDWLAERSKKQALFCFQVFSVFLNTTSTSGPAVFSRSPHRGVEIVQETGLLYRVHSAQTSHYSSIVARKEHGDGAMLDASQVSLPSVCIVPKGPDTAHQAGQNHFGFGGQSIFYVWSGSSILWACCTPTRQMCSEI